MFDVRRWPAERQISSLEHRLAYLANPFYSSDVSLIIAWVIPLVLSKAPTASALIICPTSTTTQEHPYCWLLVSGKS